MIQTVEISTRRTGSCTKSIIKSCSAIAGQTLIGTWPTACSACGITLGALTPSSKISIITNTGKLGVGIVAVDIALHAGASNDVVAWFALAEHAVPGLIGSAVLDAEAAAHVVASLAHTC